MRRLIAFALIAVLSGCASATAAEKTGTGELRHDTAPLVDRFPLLDGLDEATWLSGTFGDSPGPSLYWIDAIVVLPEEQYAELTGDLDTEAGDPQPVDDLPLPGGSFERSDELDRQFSPGEYRTQVYLSDDHHSLVILSVFE